MSPVKQGPAAGGGSVDEVLSDTLLSTAGTVNVVLVSQEGCPFCTIVRRHYLKPLAAEGRGRIQVAEVELGSRRRLLGFRSEKITHAEFGKAYGVQFAPTVMFLGPKGEELTKRIVGFSQDYFGAYLEAAIDSALAAGR